MCISKELAFAGSSSNSEFIISRYEEGLCFDMWAKYKGFPPKLRSSEDDSHGIRIIGRNEMIADNDDMIKNVIAM